MKEELQKERKVPPPVYGGRIGGGRFSTRSLRSIGKAQSLRKQLTDAEKKLWRLLRGKQLEGYKFRRQQPVGPYIADFLCAQKGLIIELDGGQHADIQRQVYDKQRTVFLRKAGYKVLRYWNNDVLQNIEGIYEDILHHLMQTSDAFSPHPTLPRKRGRTERA